LSIARFTSSGVAAPAMRSRSARDDQAGVHHGAVRHDQPDHRHEAGQRGERDGNDREQVHAGGAGGRFRRR